MFEGIRNSNVMRNPTTKKVMLGAMYTALGTLAIFGVRAIIRRMANKEGVEVDV